MVTKIYTPPMVKPREPNPKILKELNKQFPKGDSARGKALALFAIAQYEIEKLYGKIEKLEEELKGGPR